jgi:hypothetical protein
MPPLPDTPQHLAPDPAGDRASPPRWRRRLPVAALVAAVLAVAVAAGVTVADDGGPADDVAATAAASTTTHEPTTTVPSTRSTTSTTVPTTSTTAPPSPTPTTAAPAVAPPSPSPPPTGGALCIGDSVMLGASPQFLNTLSMCATVDAEQSRQFSSAPAAVAAHAPFPAAVVVHLGNNGTVDRDDIDAVMAQLAGVPRVVFVTVQLNGTRSWEGQANGEIRAAADRYPNVAIADWKAASDGHRDYAREDGIHMSPAGAGAYAATIAAAL